MTGGPARRGQAPAATADDDEIELSHAAAQHTPAVRAGRHGRKFGPILHERRRLRGGLWQKDASPLRIV
jgi:hypothetical protein